MSITAHHVKLPNTEDQARIPIELGNVGSWRALSWVRNKPTWTEPTVYHDLHNHPNLASSLLILKPPTWSTTLAIYPICTLSIDHNLIVKDGNVCSNVRRVNGEGEQLVWVVVGRAEGVEERDIVRSVVDKGRELVGGKRWGRKSDFWDGLSVCTYEGLGGAKVDARRPTVEILKSLMPSFSISTFLIDDGWQDIVQTPRPKSNKSRRRLHSFNPWSDFGSMKEFVALANSRDVPVGVWLTLQGYWDGIDPDSELGKKYEVKAYEMARGGQPRGGAVQGGLEGGGEEVWFPAEHKVAAFWRDYFEAMHGWGISYVKVDNQAHFDTITGPGSARIHQIMWSSMLDAVQQVWGSTDPLIMCMAHNERMLSGPGGLGFDRPEGDLLFRNSDDFNCQYLNCHVDFVCWNLYETILTSHLSLVPDFDMFASNPPSFLPTYHALLRCLSPGPLLLSDAPDVTTDLGLLARMTAKGGSGKTVGVQTDQAISVLSSRWLWENVKGQGEGPALLGGVSIPSSHAALIGAWNVRDVQNGGRAIDQVALRDIGDALGRDLSKDDEHVLYVTGLSSMEKKWDIITSGWKGSLDVLLEKNECELFIVAKVWNIGGCRVAVLGIMDKFAPLAGVAVHCDSRTLSIRSKFETSEMTILDVSKGTRWSCSMRADETVALKEDSLKTDELPAPWSRAE